MSRKVKIGIGIFIIVIIAIITILIIINNESSKNNINNNVVDYIEDYDEFEPDKVEDIEDDYIYTQGNEEEAPEDYTSAVEEMLAIYESKEEGIIGAAPEDEGNDPFNCYFADNMLIRDWSDLLSNENFDIEYKDKITDAMNLFVTAYPELDKPVFDVQSYTFTDDTVNISLMDMKTSNKVEVRVEFSTGDIFTVYTGGGETLESEE